MHTGAYLIVVQDKQYNEYVINVSVSVIRRTITMNTNVYLYASERVTKLNSLVEYKIRSSAQRLR